MKLLPDHVHARREPSPSVPHYHPSLSTPFPYQEWPERPRTIGRRNQSPYSQSPQRISGPREPGPRSILNDPIPHHSPVSIHHQQPVRHSLASPATHYQSRLPNAQTPEQVLPPIQNFHRRPDEVQGYPPGYEQQPILESPHHMSRTFPMIPSPSAPASPAASQPIPYPAAAPNPHYGAYQAPYGGEVDYPSPHAINRRNSPSRVAINEASEGGRHKKRRGNLPKPVTDILRAWFHEHLDHPYPSEEDKQMFITRTGLTISQVSQRFSSMRFYNGTVFSNRMLRSATGLSMPGGDSFLLCAIEHEQRNQRRVRDKDLRPPMKKRARAPRRTRL